MSKASEWAKAGGRPKDRMTFVSGEFSVHTIMRRVIGGSVPRASFMVSGHKKAELTAAGAAALGRFLIATFGDAP